LLLVTFLLVAAAGVGDMCTNRAHLRAKPSTFTAKHGLSVIRQRNDIASFKQPKLTAKPKMRTYRVNLQSELTG